MKTESEFRRKRAERRAGLPMQQRTKEGNILVQLGAHIEILPGNGTMSGAEKAKLFPPKHPGRGTISKAVARRKRRDASGKWIPGSSKGKQGRTGRVITQTRMRDEKRR